MISKGGQVYIPTNSDIDGTPLVYRMPIERWVTVKMQLRQKELQGIHIRHFGDLVARQMAGKDGIGWRSGPHWDLVDDELARLCDAVHNNQPSA